MTVWKQQAENEHSLVSVALTEDPDLIKGRLMHALNYIDQETAILDDPDFKLVIFTGFNATLNAFLSLFNDYYKDTEIYAVAFGKGMSREALEDSVYSFQNDRIAALLYAMKPVAKEETSRTLLRFYIWICLGVPMRLSRELADLID